MYDSKIAQSISAEFCAIGTVLKAQYGNIKDLYGSKLRTPISPRAISYENLRLASFRAGVSRGGSGIVNEGLLDFGGIIARQHMRRVRRCQS